MIRYHLTRLSENFRSAKAICRAAENLISHNGERIPIVPMRDLEGSVSTKILDDESQEEKFCLKHVRFLRCVCAKPSIAILCRTNPEVHRWAEIVRGENLSVSTRFDCRTGALPEKWDMLRTTISFFANPHSDYLAFKFVVSISGKEKAEQWRQEAIAAKRTINDLKLGFSTSPATDPNSIKGFLDAKTSVPLATVDWLVERLKEMPSGLSMSDISLFLIEFESQGQEGFDQTKDVIVSTIHSFKSLESDHVICPGWSEGFFPMGNDDIFEERRAAYVAITRARDSLLITCPLTRRTKWSGIRECEPSRFAEEINVGVRFPKSDFYK